MPGELSEALAEVRRAWEDGRREIRARIDRAGDVAALVCLGEKYMACLEASKDRAEEQLRRLREESERARAGWEERMAAWRRELDSLLAIASHSAPGGSPASPVEPAEPQVEAAAPVPVEPGEEEVAAALQKAYQAVVARQPYSRVVDLPDLYRETRQILPSLSIARYKEVLNRLCDRCVIDLQPVNNRSMIREPEFSISTSLGEELYYALWR